MTTHTPWTVESRGYITLAGVADMSRVFDNNAPEGAKLIAQCFGPEAHKHAHLIAAAPETAAERDKLKAINEDLIQALESLCGLMPQTRPGNMRSDEYRIWLQADKARAAIAKAQPA